MAINYKKCPNCGSTNVLGILYGMPTHEAFLKAEAGEIKLGGCCITGNDPEYFCKDCENEWDKRQVVDHAYNQINAINASVGGYFEGCYEVKIDFKNSNLKWKHFSEGFEEAFDKNIGIEEVMNFVEELKNIGFLNWKQKYVDPHTLDGTQWSVEIVREGRNINKHGSNLYPEGWDRFCKAICHISGRNFE